MTELIASINQAQLRHLEKVCTPALYAEVVEDVLTRGALSGEAIVKESAPWLTGRLRGALSHEVAAGSPPPWSKYGVIGGGQVQTYGQALDQPQSRTPHYRRGSHLGSPTAGWFSNSIPKVQQAVDGFIGAAIGKIESTWHG